jgi:hypothetical protein
VAIGGNFEPTKSRLGHWGGIINFALVLMLAWAPPPLWPGWVLREGSPLIEGFYVAAMIERASITGWCKGRGSTAGKRNCAGLAIFNAAG